MIAAAVIDYMVYDILQLLADRLSGAPMKRHRNQTEMSLTGPSLRPHFWLLVSGTMLFKGEEKTRDDQLEAARQDLLSKMKDWDPAYHGTVSLRIGVVSVRKDLVLQVHVWQGESLMLADIVMQGRKCPPTPPLPLL